MSWSVGAVGKASAVRKEIAAQFQRGSKCIEPEETIRQHVKALLDASLAGQGTEVAVRVIASGSQSYTQESDPKKTNNTATITIENLWNFVAD